MDLLVCRVWTPLLAPSGVSDSPAPAREHQSSSIIGGEVSGVQFQEMETPKALSEFEMNPTLKENLPCFPPPDPERQRCRRHVLTEPIGCQGLPNSGILVIQSRREASNSLCSAGICLRTDSTVPEQASITATIIHVGCALYSKYKYQNRRPSSNKR
ncbi:unnamed protein product [Arctogadus glacialis]